MTIVTKQMWIISRSDHMNAADSQVLSYPTDSLDLFLPRSFHTQSCVMRKEEDFAPLMHRSCDVRRYLVATGTDVADIHQVKTLLQIASQSRSPLNRLSATFFILLGFVINYLTCSCRLNLLNLHWLSFMHIRWYYWKAGLLQHDCNGTEEQPVAHPDAEGFLVMWPADLVPTGQIHICVPAGFQVTES